MKKYILIVLIILNIVLAFILGAKNSEYKIPGMLELYSEGAMAEYVLEKNSKHNLDKQGADTRI